MNDASPNPSMTWYHLTEITFSRVAMKSALDTSRSDATSTHERVYQGLRQRLLTGGFLPGRSVTLRGIANQLNVSPMPVRDAVRRLIAERALEMQDNRRVLVPAMTMEKFDQIVFARQMLELELARRAFDGIDAGKLAWIDKVDESMNPSLHTGDIEGYMRGNYEFHFSIYRCANSGMLLAMLESVWLQFAPFMRVVYGRLGTEAMTDEHVAARRALRDRNRDALLAAISADIMQGMRIIGREVLSGRPPTTSKSVDRPKA